MDTIIIIHTKNPTANSVYMKISGCHSRVSVAQFSEHRYVDSETLVSIPGWGSRIFRVYNYDIYNSGSFRQNSHLKVHQSDQLILIFLDPQ